MNVRLLRHDNAWDVPSEQATQLKEFTGEFIRKTNPSISEIRIYLTKAKAEHFQASGKKELYIFLDAMPINHTSYQVTEPKIITIGDNTYALPLYQFNGFENFRQIKSSEGEVIAYVDPNYNDVYIAIDLSSLNDDVFTIVKDVLNAIQSYINLIGRESDWSIPENREVLRLRAKEYLMRDIEGQLKDKENKLRSKEEDVTHIQASLKTTFDTILDLKQKIEQLKKMDVAGVDTFIKGLDMIAEHQKVTKLEVEKDMVKIWVSDIHAFAEVNDEEKEFYIGNMEIHIDMSTSLVKFFGDNPRRGYWTANDPHPHVNGGNGTPCLGNASASIAQLCSEKDIYTAFLVCLDFLQNANTDDPAGAKVINWDYFDEDGNLVEYEQNLKWCPCCEEERDADAIEFYTVGVDWSSSRERITDTEEWCDSCNDDYAYYNEHIDESVSERLNEEINDYYREDEEEEEEDEDEEDIF